MRLIACKACRTQYDVTESASAEVACACGESIPNQAPAAVDAPVRRCASCGAAVESDSSNCSYCRSPIVRDKRLLGLICPECFARSPEAARFCTRCGIRFQPQPAPGTAPSIHCPHDQNELVARSVGSLVCHECRACHGLWLPSSDFDAAIEKALAGRRISPSDGLGGRKILRRESAAFKVVYRRCPVCGDIMNRKNYGGRSGIIIDWCGPHGSWLDADELEEIAAYIAEGGLPAAKLTEEQKKAYYAGGLAEMAQFPAASDHTATLLDLFAGLLDAE